MWRIAAENRWGKWRRVHDLPSFDSETACQKAIERLRADARWQHKRLRPLELSPVRNLGVELAERHQNFAYFVILLLLFCLAGVFKTHFGWGVGIVVFVVLAWALEMLYRFVQRVRIRNVEKWWAKPRKDSVSDL